MAKKGEMHDEVVILFKQCAVIFLESGIKTETFYRWLESFGRSHKDTLVMYRFMSKLRSTLEKAMATWNDLNISRTGWRNLKSISGGSDHVRRMNSELAKFKIEWAKKPARRRTSE